MARKRAKREKSSAILGGALLLVALLAAYSNHFHNGFHYDDGHTIVNNAAIRDLHNIPLFFRDATTFSALPSNQSYRPLVSTLLAIDYWLAHGLNPFWFHISIFAIFIALTMLLAFVIRHLLARGAVGSASSSRWIALAAAGCYALNPANADAVNYMIVSAEMIAALGVIGSFACYFAFPGLQRYFFYVLPAAIAMLAKPTAAIFPVLFAAFLFCFRGKKTPRTARVEWVPPLLICGATLLFVQHMTPNSWIAGATNPRGYFVTQPFVALLYFKTFFWPTGLSADYDLVPFVRGSDPRLWIGIGFAVCLPAVAIVAALYKKTRLIGFGLLWFLVALLPTALFPLAEVMNDYRTFLPYMGLAMSIAGAAALLVERSKSWGNGARIVALSTVALILCASGYATLQRNKVWENEETLWHDVTIKSPQNGRGLVAYGIQLLNKGDYTGALDYFHRAQRLTPRYYELLINLAVAENATGQSALAEQHFKEALQMAPSYPDSYVYYARYLLAHSRDDEARPLLHRALELSPSDLTARGLLQETGTGAAATHTKEGDALLHEMKFREAIAQYEAALEIAPQFVPALNNFAWLLSTCPDASLRNGTKALALAERANQLSRGQNPVHLRTLAAAYAENGNFPIANQTVRQAWELARSQRNSALASSLKQDGARYRSNLPLHPVASDNNP
jgi:tetratricopeptide (TPR) repeat protein